MGIFIAFAIIIFVVAYVIVSNFNHIIGCANGVARAWASVLTYERQKNKVLPQLEQLASQYQAYESGLHEKIVALRNALGSLDAGHVDAGQLERTESETHSLLRALQVTVEQYPNLQAAEVTRQLMATITAQQGDVAAAIVIFNRAVELHNDAIQTFPGHLVNELLNKRRAIRPFHDSTAASGFEYVPDLKT